jgi:hypothetical protein
MEKQVRVIEQDIWKIKYFYITDLIERKEIEVKYCPTDYMVADYMTKPITGIVSKTN